MSSVKLKHSSGNGTIINAPAANPSADITLKVPSTTGSAGQVLKVATANHSSTNAELEWAAAPAGKILQVQTALITAVETIACTADTTSGFSTVAVSITPASSSNKILLSFTINGEGNAANQQVFSTNIRKAISGGATTTLPAAAGSRAQVIANTGDLTNDATTTPSSFSVVNYPDPAGTTSAITYTVRFMYQYASSSAGTYYLNRRADTDSDAAGVPRFNSWFTAMEVSA